MRKFTPFTKLSRRKRRAKVQFIKNLIRRERHRCGGKYYDDCDQQWAEGNLDWHWSDIIFVGSKPDVYWNAEIITAGMAFHDAVEMQALDELPPYPAGTSLNDLGEEIANWRLPQDSLGGLTRHEFVNKRETEIARDNPPVIHAHYKIQRGYRGGVGLQIIVDAPCLSRTIIEMAIHDFLARGERNWISDEPAQHITMAERGHARLLHHEEKPS
ncbi:hypothetical protein U9S86_004541 [Salmonella enterica]|nr:hypothetical protein [Salmonella enterica]ELT1143513.1 hypothetical protein [Salmonella enterica]ELT1505880.1 hypothetical protein [Salmonella enterica]EMA7395059.1 hypothetical protein [Salmonella enterica]EMA7810137.1 hypothetical protein [Salmonella enterica]